MKNTGWVNYKGILSLAIGLLFASLGYADNRVLLEYRYGNQITASEVVILTNGLIIQRNRNQATYVYLSNTRLSQQEIVDLGKAVDLASSTASMSLEGEATSFGSSSGSLIGYTTEGRSVLLFGSLLREAGQKIKIVYQPGAQGKTIRQFIQNLVRDKMPLSFIDE
jgi:hypothetical protein